MAEGTPPAQSANFYCCDYSRQVGEQLFGTAPRADVWFLLEYPQVWGADALGESSLPESVKARIKSWQAAIPKTRVQLIKQDRQPTRRQPGTGTAFYVAVTRELEQAVYEFALQSYDDLLSLDVPAIVSGSSAHMPAPGRKLILVCTNGKRDRACARYGRPVYDELARSNAAQTWQTSHLGGHRFAANVTFLPEGICYGWIAPGDVRPLLDDYAAARITLASLRGRSCYDEPVQAAEYYLRTQIDQRGISGFTLQRVELTAPDRWTVQFQASDGRLYPVRLSRRLSDFAVYKSSIDDKAVVVPQFRLESAD